jgi:hypothetical protein
MRTIGDIGTLVEIGIMVVAAITAWIIGLRMRHRIRKILDVKVKSETELTSLKTWMQVEDAEEESRGGKLG